MITNIEDLDLLILRELDANDLQNFSRSSKYYYGYDSNYRSNYLWQSLIQERFKVPKEALWEMKSINLRTVFLKLSQINKKDSISSLRIAVKENYLPILKYSIKSPISEINKFRWIIDELLQESVKSFKSWYQKEGINQPLITLNYLINLAKENLHDQQDYLSSIFTCALMNVVGESRQATQLLADEITGTNASRWLHQDGIGSDLLSVAVETGDAESVAILLRTLEYDDYEFDLGLGAALYTHNKEMIRLLLKLAPNTPHKISTIKKILNNEGDPQYVEVDNDLSNPEYMEFTEDGEYSEFLKILRRWIRRIEKERR